MNEPHQEKEKAPSIYDMVRGHSGKSYANELFAQVNNFFYEFGVIKPPKSEKEPD